MRRSSSAASSLNWLSIRAKATACASAIISSAHGAARLAVRPLPSGRPGDGSASPSRHAAFAVRSHSFLIISFGVFALVHIAPATRCAPCLGARASDPGNARSHPRALSLGRSIPRTILQVAVAGGPRRPGSLIQGNRAVTRTIADRLGVTIFLSLMSRPRSPAWRPAWSGRRFPPRHATRPGGVIVRAFGISSPAFVTGHFPSLFLRCPAALVPDLRSGDGFLDRAGT